MFRIITILADSHIATTLTRYLYILERTNMCTGHKRAKAICMASGYHTLNVRANPSPPG